MRSQPARCMRLEPRGDRGIAVAHRPVDGEPRIHRRERRAELFGLRARDGLQRRFVALAIPDLGVVAAFPARPDRQDDQVEDQPPYQPVRLDHAAVGEKLLQIPAHRPVVGCVRRAEIDDAARRCGPTPPAGDPREGPMGRRKTKRSSHSKLWTFRGGGSHDTHVKGRQVRTPNHADPPLLSRLARLHARADRGLASRRGRRRRTARTSRSCCSTIST